MLFSLRLVRNARHQGMDNSPYNFCKILFCNFWLVMEEMWSYRSSLDKTFNKSLQRFHFFIDNAQDKCL